MVRSQSPLRLYTLKNDPRFAPERRNGPYGSLTVNEDHVRFRIRSGVTSFGLQGCENLCLKHIAVIIQPKVKFKTEFRT